MTIGQKVYLNWYDYSLGRECLLEGEVVDNSSYLGTQWQDYVNVRLVPPSLMSPICRHFKPEKLSHDRQNVPHDDCFLICGQKQQEPQRERMMEYEVMSLEDFKKLHWNHERNHLQTDSLEAFYRLWRHRVVIRLGMQKVAKEMTYTVIHQEYPSTPAEAMQPQRRIVSDEKMEKLKQQLKEITKPRKLTAREKRSTGRLEYLDAIQTSIFD
ncbi:MAG: hypothetical protein J6O49_03655 [Bacteroidaceae bacterium]|nr:hypothetical protein [Bacteroidaceae bacterium]